MWDELLEDPIAFIIAVIVVGGVILGSLPTWVNGAAAWLVAHHIIVAAAANPIVALPGCDGGGLDLRRAIICAAALIALMALSYFPARRRLRREI